MRIKRYNYDYGRRALMEKVLKGVASAGVLAPLWPLIGNAAEWKEAYPDELISIEEHTKGKIKPGDVITADNLEHVEHLLDPISVWQVREDGREIVITEPQPSMEWLTPVDWLEATLRNKGRAILDINGNVWDREPGNPWIGGEPFPEPETGLQASMNKAMSWTQGNGAVVAVRAPVLNPQGEISYDYDLGWVEMNVSARVDGKIWREQKDILRYNTVGFTSPGDVAGTTFLSIWDYDQRKFPEFMGYMPAFRRVRRFPMDQRFEPLAPGMTTFLSDAWAAGDPMLTWGNFKIVKRGPMLGAFSPLNWAAEDEQWLQPRHGGRRGQTYMRMYKELCPEVLEVHSEPVGYPRAPVGKRITWYDVRNGQYLQHVNTDRRGDMWKQFEPGYARYERHGYIAKQRDNPARWTWCQIHSFDVQSRRMDQITQVNRVTNLETTHDFEDRHYDRYLSRSGIQRFGG